MNKRFNLYPECSILRNTISIKQINSKGCNFVFILITIMICYSFPFLKLFIYSREEDREKICREKSDSSTECQVQ